MLPRSKICVETVSPRWEMGRGSGILRRILPVLSCCCVFLAGCGNEPSEPDRIPVVQLSEQEVTVGVGDSIHLHLLPMLPPGYVPPVTWSSSSPETASVEPVDPLVGLVRGLIPGQAVIRVSNDEARDSARVVVLPTEPQGR